MGHECLRGQPVLPSRHLPEALPHRFSTAILQKFLNVTDGRDKTYKVMQYTAKVFLLVAKRSDFHKALGSVAKRLENMTSTFSTTRKILRLGHMLESWDEMQEVLSGKQPLWTHTRVNLGLGNFGGDYFSSKGDDNCSNSSSRSSSHSIDIYHPRMDSLMPFVSIANDISDDLYCLGKIGVLFPGGDKVNMRRLELFSAVFWMIGIIHDLHAAVGDLAKINMSIQQTLIASRARLPPCHALPSAHSPSSSLSSLSSPGSSSPSTPTMSPCTSPSNSHSAADGASLHVVASSPVSSGGASRVNAGAIFPPPFTLTEVEELRTSFEKLLVKRYLVYVAMIKLLGDFGFCMFDIFEFEFSSGLLPAVCGWVAGILGLYRRWLKCQ